MYRFKAPLSGCKSCRSFLFPILSPRSGLFGGGGNILKWYQHHLFQLASSTRCDQCTQNSELMQIVAILQSWTFIFKKKSLPCRFFLLFFSSDKHTTPFRWRKKKPCLVGTCRKYLQSLKLHLQAVQLFEVDVYTRLWNSRVRLIWCPFAAHQRSNCTFWAVKMAVVPSCFTFWLWKGESIGNI